MTTENFKIKKGQLKNDEGAKFVWLRGVRGRELSQRGVRQPMYLPIELEDLFLASKPQPACAIIRRGRRAGNRLARTAS